MKEQESNFLLWQSLGFMISKKNWLQWKRLHFPPTFSYCSIWHYPRDKSLSVKELAKLKREIVHFKVKVTSIEPLKASSWNWLFENQNSCTGRRQVYQSSLLSLLLQNGAEKEFFFVLILVFAARTMRIFLPYLQPWKFFSKRATVSFYFVAITTVSLFELKNRNPEWSGWIYVEGPNYVNHILWANSKEK